MTAEQIVAIATVAQSAAVVAGLVFARRQIIAARQLREDQAQQAAEVLHTSMRPYVTAHLDAETVGMVYLVIQNHGRSPAFDISFDVTPPIIDSVRFPEHLTPLTEGLRSIVPGQRMVCVFEFIIGRSDDLPQTWNVMVGYRDRDGNRYDEEQTLSFADKWGSVPDHRNGLHEIHAQLEKIEKHMSNWDAGINSGLRIRTDQDLEADAQQWKQWRRESERDAQWEADRRRLEPPTDPASPT